MTLKEHIDDIGKSLEQGRFPNETEVCDKIVHRILDVLNWPRYDHGVRLREYELRGLRVDFALCHPVSEPQVFIEVKRIGNIDGAEDQLFGYASRENVPIAVLTDGQKWQFFYPSGLGNYDRRKVDELDLKEGDSEENAERFNKYLSYKAICEGEAARAIQGKYEELTKQREIEKHLPDAWKNLVKSGDELLLELVADATRELCGHSPANEQVLDFLKTLERKSKPPPPLPPNGGRGGKASPTRLHVTMDDGKIIDHEAGADTFVAVIEKLGIEQVLAFGLGSGNHPLILPKNRGDDPGKGRRSDTFDRYSIYTVFSTRRKQKLLEEIAKRLGRQLQINIVPK